MNKQYWEDIRTLAGPKPEKGFWNKLWYYAGVGLQYLSYDSVSARIAVKQNEPVRDRKKNPAKLEEVVSSPSSSAPGLPCHLLEKRQ